MVLLTSSAISAVISGGIICTFTFLLFLSGYVLQQQTLRSLQEALKNPPEKVSAPKLVLPPQFQKNDDEATIRSQGADQIVLFNNTADAWLDNTSGETSPRELWYEYIEDLTGRDLSRPEDAGSGDAEADAVAEGEETLQTSDVVVSKENLAYIFSLSNINSLCSAVLFAKQHRRSTRIIPQPRIIFLYPAIWEIYDDRTHVAAMDLLREMQDVVGVTLHPVTISRIWAGISVEQQLLAELQRYRWPYDRAMYLDSPGMVVDLPTLDKALAKSNTKASWTLLHPNPKSYEASHPPVLLWAAGRGLLYPRVEMKRLTLPIGVSSTNRYIKDVVDRADADLTAYVLFNEKKLETMHGGIFERFDRDRRNACAGTDLME